jgi:uncharacterized protein YegL/HEAT repeat protein
MRAVLVLLAASAFVGPARALDEASEAAARLQEKWTSGTDSLKPEEVDAQRAALLEPVVASGSTAGLDAVLTVALERARRITEFRDRLKELDKRDKEKAEAEKSGEKPKGLDRGAAQAAWEEEKQAKEDREKVPGRITREERWQPKLADAAGALVDALPDAEFSKTGATRIRAALQETAEGWEEWLIRALGLSKKERTARVLLDASTGALGEYRKALAALVKPSVELTDVSKEKNERIKKYLDQNPGAPGAPEAALGNLPKKEKELEAIVSKLTGEVAAANATRNVARSALGRMLAGAPEDVRDRLLGFVEKEVLGSSDFEVRCFGLLAVGPCPGDRAMAILRAAAKEPMADVVVAALDSISRRNEAEALDLLVAALADGRWQVRAMAAEGLANLGRAAAVPPMIAALAKAESRGIDDLGAALRKLTGQKFPPVAAAWEEWWTKAGAGFRGPNDPGGASPGGAEGGDGATADGGGNRISFYGIESRSDKVIFILDFSGSMAFPGSEAVKSRKKIDILYEQMRKTLTGLPDGTKFNIVAFSFDVRLWKKQSAVRDAKIAKEAIDWVEKQKVDGGTNIYDALDTAFRLVGVGAADKNYQPNYDTIFFMTDGVPSAGRIRDTDAILGEVRRWNEGRRIKLHVVGMGGKEEKGQPGGGGGGRKSHSGQRGDDIDKDFLEKLAKQNGGDVVFR